jgi:putative oxidoreductase
MPLRAPATQPDAGLLVLRVGIAAVVLFHGVFKLTHGVAWIAGPLGQLGLPAFLAYGVYLAEIVAPLLLIIGLWTRLAALVIAFQMVMAVLLARRGDVTTVNEMGGGWAIELEVLIFVGAVTIALAGSGRYALRRS